MLWPSRPMSRRSNPCLAGVPRRRPNEPQFRALLGELELGELEFGEFEFSDFELCFAVCSDHQCSLEIINCDLQNPKEN